MSTASITNVIEQLFSAPLNAATNAEKNYRKIWLDWIDHKVKLLEKVSGNTKTEGTKKVLKPEIIANMFNQAPIVSLEGTIDIGITMRISSVKESGGEVSAGIQVGPVHAGGKFSFMNQKSEESMFQAATSFALGNTDKVDLKTYLENMGLDTSSANALADARKILSESK